MATGCEPLQARCRTRTEYAFSMRIAGALRMRVDRCAEGCGPLQKVRWMRSADALRGAH